MTWSPASVASRKIKRTGHGGTLDPLAEGVLPMAVGQACRLIDYLPSDKSYYGEILLGKKTATDDLEGEVLEEKGSAAYWRRRNRKSTGPISRRGQTTSARLQRN